MIKELLKELLREELEGAKSITQRESKSPFIGQLVMVRTYSAGVHFGTLVSKDGQNVVLENAHRVHYWAKACSLSQLAMEGDKDISNARISMAVTSIELDRAIEVIPMSQSVFSQLTSNIWKK